MMTREYVCVCWFDYRCKLYALSPYKLFYRNIHRQLRACVHTPTHSAHSLIAHIGVNSATGEYVDMIDSGIIDPTKVVKSALIDASGVSSLLTTCEAIIVDLPKTDSPMPPAAGMGGGMGGMPGGMGNMF